MRAGWSEELRRLLLVGKLIPTAGCSNVRFRFSTITFVKESLVGKIGSTPCGWGTLLEHFRSILWNGVICASVNNGTTPG